MKRDRSPDSGSAPERQPQTAPLTQRIRGLLRRALPLTTRRRLARLAVWPPVRLVWFGSLRRLRPISRVWGSDRGQPVDRYYVDRFLAANTRDIHGRVLEIKDDLYTTRFGGGRVTTSDILHPEQGNPAATLVADLTRGDDLPGDAFDCIIFTQTLHLIYDVRAALATLHRILKPGGVLLATVSGISKISREDMDRWGHNWSFTTKSARLLFEEFFPSENVQVEAHGNVLTAIAFLHGLASEELRRKELDHRDPDYQVLITVRAVKPEHRP
jgi:SAM-dependent methyltransferase